MSKPIFFTPQMKKECIEEFIRKLDTLNLLDGKIKYETSYFWPKDKDENGKEIADFVTVIFSERAKAKQELLVREFTTEVGWHGIAHRDAHDPKVFHIDDIIVFPQRVSGATVTPDQTAYEQWLMKLPDEQFNACRYHGHSHVQMGTTPSGTDDRFQLDTLGRLRGEGMAPGARKEFVKQLGDSAFYIFMILNKRGEFNVRVFDLVDNKYYSGTQEVHVQAEGQHTWDAFLQEAKRLVTTGYVTPPYRGTTPIVQGGGSQTYLPAFCDDDHRRFPREYGYSYDDIYGRR